MTTGNPFVRVAKCHLSWYELTVDIRAHQYDAQHERSPCVLYFVWSLTPTKTSPKNQPIVSCQRI